MEVVINVSTAECYKGINGVVSRVIVFDPGVSNVTIGEAVKFGNPTTDLFFLLFLMTALAVPTLEKT